MEVIQSLLWRKSIRPYYHRSTGGLGPIHHRARSPISSPKKRFWCLVDSSRQSTKQSHRRYSMTHSSSLVNVGLHTITNNNNVKRYTAADPFIPNKIRVSYNKSHINPSIHPLLVAKPLGIACSMKICHPVSFILMRSFFAMKPS